MTRQIRRYSELILLPTFEERFKYLSVGGRIGIETFGGDRLFNQAFYTSKEWRDFRNYIITRDLGCDLAHPDHQVPPGMALTVHHLVPLTMDDLEDHSQYLLNPEYAVTTTDATHKAIHYGDDSYLSRFNFVIRKPNDQAPWKRGGENAV